jgi:hypothetical protein
VAARRRSPPRIGFAGGRPRSGRGGERLQGSEKLGWICVVVNLYQFGLHMEICITHASVGSRNALHVVGAGSGGGTPPRE